MQQSLKGHKWNAGVSWLLQGSNPSLRYWTMRDLLGYSESDSEVEKARSQILLSDFVKGIQSDQAPAGHWGFAEDVYWPKWRATVWPLILLAELGVPGDTPWIRRGCEHFLRTMDAQDRSWPTKFAENDIAGYRSVWEPCVTGNMARTLVQFGYADDPRVKEMFDWLVKTQWKDGGWNCDEGWKPKEVNHSSFMSTIEPLWAFSALESSKWPKGGREAVDRGIEFVLAHRLYKSDKTFRVISEEWTKLHFPLFYFYDILHGLRVLAALGRLDDKRIYDAIQLLKTKETHNGLWSLEASFVRSMKANFVKDPSTGEWKLLRGENLEQVPSVYDQLGKVGDENPWITLNALRVLSRLE